MPELSSDFTEHRSHPASGRVRLARAALGGALGVRGVRGGDSGPAHLHFTAGSGERLEGVTCSATERGYLVALRLVCALTPLDSLAEEVREAVRVAARQAGVLELLDGLDLYFSDLELDEPSR